MRGCRDLVNKEYTELTEVERDFFNRILICLKANTLKKGSNYVDIGNTSVTINGANISFNYKGFYPNIHDFNCPIQEIINIFSKPKKYNDNIDDEIKENMKHLKVLKNVLNS